MNKMNDDINKKLDEILLKRTGINFEDHSELKRKNFLGKELKIPARELVLICFDIERAFLIQIPEEEILLGSVKDYEKTETMLRKLLNLS